MAYDFKMPNGSIRKACECCCSYLENLGLIARNQEGVFEVTPNHSFEEAKEINMKRLRQGRCDG